MKKIILLSAVMLFASCGSPIYYQVCKTQSQTVKPNGEVISYDDSRCRIDYNLWAEHGDAGFVFYNKTDEVIHLLLDESFYVLNDVAYDYYQNRAVTEGSSSVIASSSGIGFGGYSRFGVVSAFSKSTVSGSTKSITVTEPKTISIPPKTAKRISEFDISQTTYRDCDLLRYPSARKVKSKVFSATDSPLKFYNAITYKVGANENKITVRNDFHVSEITNYPDKEMFKTVSKEFCGEKDYNRMRVFKDIGSDRFYIKYAKEEGWKH